MNSLPRHHPPEPSGCPRPTLPAAFSLIELLVVISVLAILLALLLPALGSAKNAAKTTQCAANLRGVGQAMVCYTGENGDALPMSYTYKNDKYGPSGQTPAVPDAGIVHWSDVLCSSGYSQRRALMCPSFDRGGLPPANSSADNLEPSQTPWTPGIVDQQVSRCAYTVNQALCPTNRLVLGYQGAITASRAVKISSVRQPAATILATEWTHTWSMVHRPGVAPSICESYLPVHAFAGVGPMATSDRCDLNMIGNPHPCFGDYRRLEPADLSSDPALYASNRLDWVGRNHGAWNAKSNFVYADGHVETKPLSNTLNPFEWGQECWSIVGRTIAP